MTDTNRDLAEIDAMIEDDTHRNLLCDTIILSVGLALSVLLSCLVLFG